MLCQEWTSKQETVCLHVRGQLHAVSLTTKIACRADEAILKDAPSREKDTLKDDLIMAWNVKESSKAIQQTNIAIYRAMLLALIKRQKWD